MGQYVNPLDTLHAETVVFLKATEIASYSRLGCIVIETDATTLRNAIQSCGNDSARYGVLSERPDSRLSLVLSFSKLFLVIVSVIRRFVS